MAALAAAALGLAGSLFISKKAGKDAKAQRTLGEKAIAAADPYAKYRPEAAEKLRSLMSDPSSITSTPEYKSRLDAAARTVASQGYTGSGNAILEAANAAGAAYQQSFDNLSLLSGAGQAPGGGYNSALSANQSANDNRLSSIGGAVNNGSNLLLNLFNRPATAPAAGASGSNMGIPMPGSGALPGFSSGGSGSYFGGG